MSPRTADPSVPEALLDAARVEFSRRGLTRARVEDICRQAGVSKGAFYLHFSTKEDAFRVILQRFLGALEEHTTGRKKSLSRLHQLASEKATASASVLDELCEAEMECALEQLEFFWRNRQIVAALDGAGAGGFLHLVQDSRRRMRRVVMEDVVEAQSAGRYRPTLDPEFVADLFVGAHESFARRMTDMRTKPDLTHWAKNLLDLAHAFVITPILAKGSPPENTDRTVINKR